MAAIKYNVPYQLDVQAKDLNSGKPINTAFYLKNGVAIGPPPAYGADIPGSSEGNTMLDFKTRWDAFVGSRLTSQYQMLQLQIRAMIGWGYGTPFITINAVITGGATTLVQTALPHGLTSGESVVISGVTTPVAVNGVWLATVLNLHQFTIPVVTAGAWTGPGTVQRAFGPPSFVYTDKETTPDTTLGGIVADGLPLYANVSIRRLNAGVGRAFRSRWSMPCVPEADQKDGELLVLALANWTASLALLPFPVVQNGNAETTGMGQMFQMAVSRKKASESFSPFTESASWSKQADTFLPHRRLGSQVQRKPKLAGS